MNRVSTRSVQDAGHAAGQRVALRDPFWPAQVTVLAAIALQISLPSRITLGPFWLLPGLEGILLLALVIATPHPDIKHSPVRRRMALVLIGVVSLVNFVSLLLLVHYLIQGGKAGGHPLILAGVVLWVTNVLLFGLWYWEIDRGGPVARAMNEEALPDFLFPQMDHVDLAPEGWMPGYLDYMYTSFTNATAFSPTDTMPLTYMAKLLMASQSIAALVTIGLVVARAVNILA